MSETGNPSSSSWPSRYSRVRARHWVGLLVEMADATGSCGSWSCGPVASPGPDADWVIVRLWTIRPGPLAGTSPISAPGPLLGEQLVGTDPVGVVVGDGGDDQLVGLGGVTEPFQLVRDLARGAGELGVGAVGDQPAVGVAPHVAPGF